MGNTIVIKKNSQAIKYNESNFTPVEMSYKLGLPWIISILILYGKNDYVNNQMKILFMVCMHKDPV